MLDHPCCDSSSEAGEQQFASAPRTSVWLLLEYNGPWGAKALEESGLSERVRQKLQHAAQVIPNARVQFIRQTGDNSALSFYLARSDPQNRFMYSFRLHSYDDLLDLNLPAIANAHTEHTLSDEKLYLVCTNGKRDLCCARDGLPFYKALSQAAPGQVWQTTHIGGHRFSATMVYLPRGLYYGRLRPEQAATVVEATQRGEVLLDHMRGLCGYDAPVQAADYWLRREIGARDFKALAYDGHERADDTRWRVLFRGDSGQRYQVRVRAQAGEVSVYESSTDEQKKQPTQYYLDGYDVAFN